MKNSGQQMLQGTVSIPMLNTSMLVNEAVKCLQNHVHTHIQYMCIL